MRWSGEDDDDNHDGDESNGEHWGCLSHKLARRVRILLLVCLWYQIFPPSIDTLATGMMVSTRMTILTIKSTHPSVEARMTIMTMLTMMTMPMMVVIMTIKDNDNHGHDSSLYNVMTVITMVMRTAIAWNERSGRQRSSLLQQWLASPSPLRQM